MNRHFRMILILIVMCAHAPLLATTAPETGKFPAGFWNDVLSGSDSLRYGNPGWVKRIALRRATREQISRGQATLAALDQAKFHLPVLLGSFSDMAGGHTAQEFNNLLFGENAYGSLSEYFDEISYGQFQLTGEVAGWFTVDNPQTYYSNGDYGSGSSDFPQNKHGFVRDVAAAADDSVNFALFDNDGPDGEPNSGDDDGYVDGVCVVFPGLGPNQSTWGDQNNLWPSSSSLSSANEYVTDDIGANGEPVIISTWLVVPEEYTYDGVDNVLHPIGMIAHEFGHVLGLPDLYDRTDDTEGPDFNDSQGVGRWCLMANGNYGGDGDHPESPSHMSAWCKMIMGWVTPLTVQQVGSYNIPSAETSSTVYRLWEDDYELSSYFLVENRQQTLFDRYLPGDGLIVYHVDELRWFGETKYSSGVNNNDETHKLVDIEAADGFVDMDDTDNSGDDGDPFPGSTGNRTFSTNSFPDSRGYDGEPSGVRIEDISDSGPNMSATLAPHQPSGYALAYDENGITGWGWGLSNDNAADYWGGVLFTPVEDGVLTSLDLGFRNDNDYSYTIDVYDSFQFGTPSNLLSTFSDSVATKGWYTFELPAEVPVEKGNDVFVSIKIEDMAFAVSYDRYGEHSMRSYTSSDGINFSDGISTSSSGGDINIRARILTDMSAISAVMAVPVSSVAFGTVSPGSSASRTLYVGNTGGAALMASLAVAAGGASGDIFSVSPTSVAVGSGDSVEVTVTFSPVTEDTDYSSSLVISSPDTSVTVALTGTGKTLAVFRNSIGDETFKETTGSYELWVELNPVVSNPDVSFVYSLDGETISGGGECVLVDSRWVGSIPAQPLGSTILYYFIVSGSGEVVYTLPAGAPIDSYTLTVALTKPGDLDGNWVVNIFDLLDLLKVLGGQDDPGGGDVDSNGKVDIFDLLELLKMMGRD
jgi:immune inhibitor A